MAGVFLTVVTATLCISLAALWSAVVRISGIQPESPVVPPLDRSSVFAKNNRLQSAQKIAEGLVHGPEDLAIDIQSGSIFTACSDGWIKKISFADKDFSTPAKVENWTYVHGRPLGLIFGLHGELIVTVPDLGLVNVTHGHYDVLVEEFQGQKITFADGVDVASDGMIYFTDLSTKYHLHNSFYDILEGKPYGRLFKYDPATKTTSLLLSGLYHANGVSLSPDQDFLVYCETSMFRCSKYWLKGDKKGTTGIFVENLPGFPDNIRYDGNGVFWIAQVGVRNWFWSLTLANRYTRQVTGGLWKLTPSITSFAFAEAGFVSVDVNGKVLDFYSTGTPNNGMILMTGAAKYGDSIFFGFLNLDFIGRVQINQDKSRTS